MGSALTVGDLFRNAARAVPNRAAVTLGSEVLTFGGLDVAANRAAHALNGMGIGIGDRVAVWSNTTLDVVPLFAGLAKVGAVFAPVGGGLGPDEAAAIVTATRPTLLVTDGDHALRSEALVSEAAVPLANLDGLAGPLPAEARLGPGVSLAALAEAAPSDDVRAADLSEDDPHVIFFTSGSTGKPKGVVLSHRVSYLRGHPGVLLEPRGTMVCPYPLFHMGAWTLALQQWQARDLVVFVGATDAGAIAKAVSTHSATRINAIPAIWRRLLEDLPAAEREPALASLRFADTGTSATPVELLEAIETAAPQAHIRVFYGSTEAGSVASLDHADFRRKPGSCGVPGPAVEARLDDGGELWVRGPLLFDGYFEDPDATAEALVDGWYRTGDLAEEDDDGYLTIVGRARDVIRTGGETVAPAEVEAVLGGYPGIAEVAVVGLPDARWGEVVCAVVVVARGQAAPTLEGLRAHCATRLASFKHPRRLAIVTAIPRTAATAQVQRRLLAEQLTLR